MSDGNLKTAPGPVRARRQSRRKVGLLVYEWSTRLMGGSIRAISFARNLPAHGWDVTVVTASPPEEWPERPPGVSAHHVRSPERSLGGGITVEHDSRLDANPGWLKALGKAKSLLPLERQLSWYPALWSEATSIFRRAGVEAIVTVVAPNVMMPAGHALAERLGVPHLIDLRDDFADRHRVEPISGAYQRLLNLYGHFYLRRAASVSVVSPVTAQRLREKGVASRLIMNGYVEDHFSHVSWQAEPVPVEGPLRLVHLGWLGDFRSIASLTHAVALLAPEEQRALHIDQYGLIDPAQTRLLEACPCVTRVFPQLPHAEAVEAMRTADGLVAIPGDRVPAAMTGKLFEYLRVRRPILLIAGEGAAADLARNAGLPHVVPPGNPAALAAVLRSMLARKRAGNLRAASSEDFVRGLERGEGARMLADELNRVVA